MTSFYELDVLDILGNHDVTIDFESLADKRRVVAPLSKLFMSDTNVQSICRLEQVFPDLEALGMAGNQINSKFLSATIASLSKRGLGWLKIYWWEQGFLIKSNHTFSRIYPKCEGGCALQGGSCTGKRNLLK